MKFVPGKVLKEFVVEKNGKKIMVKFRLLKLNEDVKEMTEYINKMVSEPDNYLSINKALSIAEEKKWYKGKLKEQKGRSKYIVVEANGKYSGALDIRFGIWDNSHTADFGLGISKDIRGLGIGTELLRLGTVIAKKIGAEILYISTYGKNKKAQHIYMDKLGFKKYGVKPLNRKQKINGKDVYDDSILLWRKA